MLIVGLVTAAGLGIGWAVTVVDGFDRLAHAPAGCSTTIEVTRTGTYQVFIGTRGVRPVLSGGCDAPSGEYTVEGTVDPDVTIVDATGQIVPLTLGGWISYETPTSSGRPYATVSFDAPGAYQVTVADVGEDFDIVIGQVQWAIGLLIAALATGFAAVVLGVTLMVSGRRLRRAATR